MSLLLIRYNEPAIKSPRARSRLQNRLIANIENSFLENKLECTIDHDRGRIYIYPEDEKKGIELLRHIFGIVSISPVVETTSDIDTISQQAIGIASNMLKKNMTFAIRSRRTGSHDYTSQELAKRVGADILKANSSRSVTVDLTEPDIEIFIEVRNDKAFIFTDKIKGPGGLPKGVR